MKSLLVFLSMLLFVVPALGDEWKKTEWEKPKCEKLPNDVVGDYCVYRVKDGKNENVLYFMHGGDGDEHTWEHKLKYHELIRQHWITLKYDPPTIISVSMKALGQFGKYWLLVEENKALFSGMLPTFLDKLMPAIEEEIGGIKGKRFLLGESMGGFNVTQLVLKAPEKFAKAAILCPAIVEDSPYADAETIQKYVDRTGALKDTVAGIVKLSKLFVDKASWLKVSPLALAPKALNDKTPKLYVSCSIDDEYGFYEGSLKFAGMVSEKKLPIVWRELAGRHCAVDTRTVAEFLAKD